MAVWLCLSCSNRIRVAAAEPLWPGSSPFLVVAQCLTGCDPKQSQVLKNIDTDGRIIFHGHRRIATHLISFHHVSPREKRDVMISTTKLGRGRQPLSVSAFENSEKVLQSGKKKQKGSPALWHLALLPFPRISLLQPVTWLSLPGSTMY